MWGEVAIEMVRKDHTCVLSIMTLMTPLPIPTRMRPRPLAEPYVPNVGNGCNDEIDIDRN